MFKNPFLFYTQFLSEYSTKLGTQLHFSPPQTSYFFGGLCTDLNFVSRILFWFV